MVTSYFHNQVSLCRINANNTFDQCNPTSSGFNKPFGVTLNNAKTRAFIANQDNSTVSSCTVGSAGELSARHNIQGVSFSGPAGIVLNSANNRLFVINASNGTISSCTIDTAGNISTCEATTDGLKNPHSIAYFRGHQAIEKPYGVTLRIYNNAWVHLNGDYLKFNENNQLVAAHSGTLLLGQSADLTDVAPGSWVHFSVSGADATDKDQLAVIDENGRTMQCDGTTNNIYCKYQ